MLDLISIGTISVDLYFKGEQFPHNKENFMLKIGTKYNANYMHEGVGGGGVNVAAAAIAGGLSAGVLGFIGDNPFRSVLLTRLAQLDISQEYVQIKDEYLNVSSILLTETGERTIINYRPPYDSLYSADFDPSSLLSTHAFYLGNLPDVPIEERTKLLAFIKKNGGLIFLNLGTKDCERKPEELEHHLESVDVVILNRNEFGTLANKTPETINLEKSAFQIAPILRGKKVIVTDSAKGSYGYENDEVYFQPAIEPARIVDTTGAGDGYSGAFIACYLRTKDVKDSMEKGARYAGKIIGKVGAN
jgi:ribokinase